MKQVIFAMLCAGGLLAQETVSRLVQLKHISPESANIVLSTFSPGKVMHNFDRDRKLIGLNGPAELVDAIEAAIKKLDVPVPAVRNIELTFHMLLAAPQGESSTLPAELSGVAQQLRNVFGLKSVRVLETAVVRAREGKSMETNGIMAPVNKVEANAYYFVNVRTVAVVPSERGNTIRLDALRFNVRLPTAINNQYGDAGIGTDIDVREGQKVVVGKSSIDTASQSIFLVVTAKVVD